MDLIGVLDYNCIEIEGTNNGILLSLFLELHQQHGLITISNILVAALQYE